MPVVQESPGLYNIYIYIYMCVYVCVCAYSYDMCDLFIACSSHYISW